MADINNLADIGEQLDTVKTMLNSIRAQGVLNTSDIDKVLEGINTKLQRIDTVEDIDVIKLNLSDLKQILDERHNVLISKFGAIESLFSNLLKNSTEAVKTAEIKELFDIVATNLSVFSREVVSNKETLSDIILRLDAMQADDSKKKDIIKSISTVRNDFEKLSNGFDSIVISLNENFKTVLKTISEIDQSEAINGFTDKLNDIIDSSNTILSAIQLMDKKNVQIEDLFEGLATQDDTSNIQKHLVDLSIKSKEINDLVDTMAQKSYKIDNLSDKIDAAVNIIAGLKTELSGIEDESTNTILETLAKLEESVKEISSNKELEEFKNSLESVFETISNGSEDLKNALNNVLNNINTIDESLKILNLDSKINDIISNIINSGESVKEKVAQESDKIMQLLEINISRALNDISNNAEVLDSRLKDSHTAIAELCEKNFNEVAQNVDNLKKVISQLDETNMSSNNAMFANITDRLTLFENSLRTILEQRDNSTADITESVIEKVMSIKNLTETIDFKMDSSALELTNSKNELNDIKQSLDNLVGIDIVNVIKNVKTDLYAVKQDILDSFDNSNSELSDSYAKDLFSKYELLINKLDSVEYEIKFAQTEVLNGIKENLTKISDSIVDVLSYVSNSEATENASLEAKLDRVSESLKDSNLNYVESVRDIVDVIRIQVENNLKQISEESDGRFGKITSAIFETNNSIKESIQDSYEKLANACSNFDIIKEMLSVNNSNIKSDVENMLSASEEIKNDFESKLTGLKNSLLENITEFKNDFACLNADTLSELKFSAEQNYTSLKNTLIDIDEKFKKGQETSLEELQTSFNYLKKKITEVDSAVDEDLAHQVSIIEGNFESLNLMLVDIMNQAKEALGDKIRKELSGTTEKLSEVLAGELEQYKTQIEDSFDEAKNHNNNQAEFIKDKVLELNEILNNTLEKHNDSYALRLDDISNNLKSILTENIELTSADYGALKEKMENFCNDLSAANTELLENLKNQFDDVVKFVDSNLEIHAQDVNAKFENISNTVGEVRPALDSLRESINSIFEESSVNLATQFGNTNTELSQKIETGIKEFNTKFTDLYERLDKDEVSRMNISQAQIKELNMSFNELIEELKDSNKSEFAAWYDMLVKNSETRSNDIRQYIEDASVKNSNSINEQQTSIANFANQILAETENLKQNTNICRDVLKELMKDHVENINKSIEKEADGIVADITEQFNTLHDAQKDNISILTTAIEGSVSGYIHNALDELKSYVEIKTDSSILKEKLDNLNGEMQNALHETTGNINKLLQESVFNKTIGDLLATNEILLGSMSDKLNTKFQEFIKENISKDLSEKINIFDKNVTDTITGKFEEVKVLSGEYTKSFERISISVENLISNFTESKNEVNSNLIAVAEGLNKSVDELKAEFVSLKAQIMNKSFDEAFHEAVKNQITGVEKLIQEQLGYLDDIQDLCGGNLPELAELNTLVKHSILQTVADIKEKVELQEKDIPQELDNLKADIITQFINIFNQISFVTEQEEIEEFIQEKHDELITILSHIVTSTNEVTNVKNNITIVDNKIDSIRKEIDTINSKITSIMSSEGDVDYIYSLQDLESDIANLRLVLNEMKANDKAKEFEELISSTNNIYQLVETIKAEMPKFEAEEFKKGFDSLSEDIVSISTRTNKLLLSSDESYKMLQDNLQDFKLVIDDLDERTRNFSKESGIDKLDNKLSAINAMIQSGTKTNQVFNQVFEYLAEWVDKAGVQIASISDKVETLDEISQIKTMIEDLKASAQDDSESAELVDALSAVFDKQTKRISSLETKLDRMIVDSTINNIRPDVDITPIEDTLNRFLVAMDDKMSAQQAKINSLEEKLEEVMTLVDNKDTAQLTKKVGGMDKQLAKLNKSIEKIASNVVEK